MEFTRKDMTFQGYTIPKVKANWTAWQLRRWEREADEFNAIEYNELGGEDNDFLQVYPQQVITYHPVKRSRLI